MSLIVAGYDRGRPARVTRFETIEASIASGSIDCVGWARKLLRGMSPLSVSRRSPLLNAKGSSSKHRPDCFGPFRVRADLGTSRFGPVYLGCDPSTNTRVVIRTFELFPEWREFGEQSDLLDLFRKLCETTLDHPSVARPLAFGAEGDIPYSVSYTHLTLPTIYSV